jgi:hypothetical protein
LKKDIITLHHSIYVNKPKAEVWDFTQDYSKRMEWDKSVLEANVIQTLPQRIVRLKTRGNTVMTFVYKLDDRPNKTSLAIKEIESKWIEGGGGSWSYEEDNGGTLWSQTNTLIFKSSLMVRLILPIIRLVFQRQMKTSMQRAKLILESQGQK